jgi:outer membrane protein
MKLKIATLLTLVLFGVSAYADGNSAFINSKVLLEQSPQARDALEKMQSEFQDREANLRAMVEEINKMESDYQKDSAIMSDEQKKKIEDQIVQKKRQFQFDQQSMREDVQKRRNELLNNVRIAISKVIREYGDEKGYDFIFSDGVAYASDSVDITMEILKELEK